MRLGDCQLGDAYQDEKRVKVIEQLAQGYWMDQKGEYLSYVKYLMPRWPQLELLADFMEVGTVPTRWCLFPEEEKDKHVFPRYVYPAPLDERKKEQDHRAEKVNVALIQYKTTGRPELTRFQSKYIKEGSATANLMEAVSEANTINQNVEFSLFVVEDLSRDVIETLGAGFSIDPHFFRAHIAEYVWNNIRDRWREQPQLDIISRQRDWFQLRLVRSRYFPNQHELQNAKEEMNDFNISRRMDADSNQIFWDKDPDVSIKYGLEEPIQPHEERVDGKIGHMRSRATFWLREGNDEQSAVGVLLLEPTPKSGFPLWRGYSNWDHVPKFDPMKTYDTKPSRSSSNIPPSKRAGGRREFLSWFEDYVFWAQKIECFPGSSDPPSQLQPLAPPIQALLHLTCAEWLTFADYLNSRLNQIDWGIAKPSFWPDTDNRNQSLEKLHFWRRWVPQARDMLGGTMRQLFPLHPTIPKFRSAFDPYKQDYKIIKDRLDDYELRIDRLSTVVNSAIGLDDSKNSFNLTILASVFIPPSLIAAIFSMTTGPLNELHIALEWWAGSSVTALLLLFGVYHIASRDGRDMAKEFRKKLRFLQFGVKLWNFLIHLFVAITEPGSRKKTNERVDSSPV